MTHRGREEPWTPAWQEDSGLTSGGCGVDWVGGGGGGGPSLTTPARKKKKKRTRKSQKREREQTISEFMCGVLALSNWCPQSCVSPHLPALKLHQPYLLLSLPMIIIIIIVIIVVIMVRVAVIVLLFLLFISMVFKILVFLNWAVCLGNKRH